MSADALRWNERYRAGVEPAFGQPRSFLIEAAAYLPLRGLALDVAMGLGGNAGFLIERGLRVIGIDASEVALQQAKARWSKLMAVVADLARFQLPEAAFDVVLNFYYLQRDLWPAYRKALRPGGLLIFESLTRAALNDRPDFNPDYLLAPGELRTAFADWEILAYREGSPEVERDARRVVASLVARRRDRSMGILPLPQPCQQTQGRRHEGAKFFASCPHISPKILRVLVSLW